MIHAYIRGRLGNQLFQYAFIRMLQHHNPGVKVCYHFDEVYSAGTPEQDFVNSLKNYNVVDVREGEESPKLSFVQRVLLKLYWLRYPHTAPVHIINCYQMKWVSLLSRFGLYYLDLGYFNFPKKLPKGDVIVSGNFECEEYFREIKEQVLQELQPKNPLLSHNQDLMDIINSTNSICISIRRGDYISNREIGKLFNICNKSYYDKAINELCAKIGNPTLVFFSDDIEWVKENLQYNVPCYYERGDDPVWEKLRLMSSCKHFIISNSTFSWWAQELGLFPDKLVISPSRWYNNPIISSLIMPDWIKIDC